jgi:outer membrane receptor protein involved in Fe transport
MLLVKAGIGLAVLVAIQAAPLVAQRDTATAHTLDPLVVTAERVGTPLSASTSAVSRITADEVARTPGPTLASVLQRVPGFAVLDFDGSGWDPQLVTRGFYGGGEAEYVVVLIDGRPINQLQTGLVPWDALPPTSAIKDIEVVRGSESALYGDAALGAVINVITRNESSGLPVRWETSVGSYGSWSADAGAVAAVGERDISGSAGYDRTSGFRAHAARDAFRAQLGVPLVSHAGTTLTLNLRSYVRAYDEPGPLLASLLAQNRTASDELFRFDHTHDASTAVTLDGEHQVNSRARLIGSVTGELRETDAVQTLALAPGYGDTQQRRAANQRGDASLQLDIDDSPLPGAGRLIIGTDVGRGGLDSRYYGVQSGDASMYRAASGTPGPLDASGTSSRSTAALFGEYVVHLGAPVRLSIGARYDWLRDTFDPRAPDSGSVVVASHGAFSPKAGLNVRLGKTAAGTSNVYVTAGRSFKAPTLDQLFDQRPIPVPFPPYSVTTSNPLLRPQSGTSIEAGAYQDARWSSSVRLSASVSVYQMDMKDELDFDVQTLRYVNIGSSRHRGVEAGTVLSGPAGTSLFANYTLQSARSQSGDDIGKYLKAIPRYTLSGGGSVTFFSRLEANMMVTDIGGAYIDDANTTRLPAFTRVDGRASYPVGSVSLVVEARNLFNARYNTTGYLDPSGTGQAYFYPAAGRTLSVGLRGAW